MLRPTASMPEWHSRCIFMVLHSVIFESPAIRPIYTVLYHADRKACGIERSETRNMLAMSVIELELREPALPVFVMSEVRRNCSFQCRLRKAQRCDKLRLESITTLGSMRMIHKRRFNKISVVRKLLLFANYIKTNKQTEDSFHLTLYS